MSSFFWDCSFRIKMKEGILMGKKQKKALEFHKKGYNCAQAVACTFSEEFGIREEDAFRMAEAFGLGMGQMDMCGAITGMLMVIGMENSIGNLQNGAPTKADTYRKAALYTKKFREKNGSSYCRDLKGAKSGIPLCSCDQCIADAVDLAEEYLREAGKKRDE